MADLRRIDGIDIRMVRKMSADDRLKYQVEMICTECYF